MAGGVTGGDGEGDGSAVAETPDETAEWDAEAAAETRHPVRGRVACEARYDGGRRLTFVIYERTVEAVTEARSIEITYRNRAGRCLGEWRLYRADDLALVAPFLERCRIQSHSGAIPVIGTGAWGRILRSHGVEACVLTHLFPECLAAEALPVVPFAPAPAVPARRLGALPPGEAPPAHVPAPPVVLGPTEALIA